MNQEEINNLIDNGHMIYAFDLDGVICEMRSETEAEPVQEVIDIINDRYKRGDYICIYTARDRPNRRAIRDVTRRWLREHGVHYHELIFGKPKAHIYIDDSTVDIEEYLTNPKKYDRKYRRLGNKINRMLRDEK